MEGMAQVVISTLQLFDRFLFLPLAGCLDDFEPQEKDRRVEGVRSTPQADYHCTRHNRHLARRRVPFGVATKEGVGRASKNWRRASFTAALGEPQLSRARPALSAYYRPSEMPGSASSTQLRQALRPLSFLAKRTDSADTTKPTANAVKTFQGDPHARTAVRSEGAALDDKRLQSEEASRRVFVPSHHRCRLFAVNPFFSSSFSQVPS